ncbi:MOSC domain-containing protein [Synechococcus sp. BA-132 BA5]|uniref:MOSC domain-containing protein n=1 Tax=Synechococcus sp. BA-132 BA5 TaxID=3110252 RepID=UPI002B20A3F4|nr:MOSC domain-containing protein [Synechococcus sp. BA-132 BA5]MEA5415325.1 MOSC domain-containing protein [Synechococcus sp. BA-132 BA5]
MGGSQRVKGLQEQLVGTVQTLWRYPVKSMLGDSPQRLDVEARGIRGDRAYALWDHASGRVASAKNPRLWRDLLDYRARFREEPAPSAPLPAVLIGPRQGDGVAELCSSETDVGAFFSALFGRQVSLLDTPPEGASLDQYWPPVEGRAFQDETNALDLPAGTFFDACPIHAISTATLERLRQLEPQLDFAVERFRPNLLIETPEGAEGFVEEAWSGCCLQIGEQLVLRVDGGCPRCVVTTLAQGDLGEDLEILRATARHNGVVAGIRLSVVTPGPVAVGDPVRLLSPDGA